MLRLFPVSFFAPTLFAAILAGAESGEPDRVPWNASRLQGSPDPERAYTSEPVFEGVTIHQGLEMVAFGGRFFVVERSGRIVSFPEDAFAGSGEADFFADLKELHPDLTNVYGLAFHPEARENRQVFVTYTVDNQLDDGTRLSRFTFTGFSSDGLPPRIEAESERVILTWRSGGHNGANLQFGPDGMLYISTGDATGPSPPDILNTGQDNSDLLSCILRIDVDADSEVDGLPYGIPADNPYVDVENVRPEIWSFGFRNPWKMSFDDSGRLWVGDVGWELWEMVHLVTRGSNHGWSAMEASQPIKPETANDLAPITAPVVAHPHTEAASITGGYVYRGARFPELDGAYVYGDYETGRIWALWHDGERVERHEEIADTPYRIASFGRGSDGELYYLHYGEPTTIYRLSPNPKAGRPSDFPRRLSETGLFRETNGEIPGDGVYEFRIREPKWEDGAAATRYLALPGTSGVETLLRNNRRAIVTWPPDAVLAKTIRLGNRPVETQVLHFDGNDWKAYSYRWNEKRTDADLVGAEGEEFEVPEGGWKGGPRYRIHSRAECLRCHTVWNEFVAGFHPVQLDSFPAHPEKPAREAAVALGLADAEFFEREPGGKLLPSRGGGSLEVRARSWLHANCAHCHRRHGGGSAPLEVNFDRALSEAALLWQQPTRGDFGLHEARAVVPGEPWRSVLNYRVAVVGSGHMPSLGSREIDEAGVKLLWDWVAAMPRECETTDALPESFQATDLVDLADTSSAMRLAHAAATGVLSEEERSAAVREGLASPRPEISALFERFRPPRERTVSRGHDAAAILRLSGNPEDGARLLSPTGKLAVCFSCHRIEGEGGDFGPALDTVGSRLDRAQLLESLLYPSRTIPPEFQLWSLETRAGANFVGFFVERNEEGVVLKLDPSTARSFPVGEIRALRVQTVSAMPPGLVDALSAEELADLLAWLESLAEEIQ